MTINLHKELEAWLVVAEGMAKAGIIAGTNTTLLLKSSLVSNHGASIISIAALPQSGAFSIL